MKRVWNALRYGDWETRKCIGSVVLFSLIAIILIVAASLTNHFYLFIFGMISGVVAIILSQTFTLVDDDFVAEIKQDGSKDTVRAMSAKRNTKKSKMTKENMEENEKNLTKGRDGNELPASDIQDESKDEKRFSHYNEQVMKKIKRKYRVKADHRPIIIDYSKSYQIKECPAFIWRVHNKVFLLLLEKEPRKICISRELIKHMDYVPNVVGDRSKEYIAFRKENLVTKVFEAYLPDYFSSKERNSNIRYKHLYMIYPDIWISNRSASQVLDLLYLNFMPQNKITQSDKLNGFFKRIYSAHILYQDRVYSITEYKNEVEKTLKEMCFAEIPDREFMVTLENLVKGKLISQTYADYYYDHRDEIVARKKSE